MTKTLPSFVATHLIVSPFLSSRYLKIPDGIVVRLLYPLTVIEVSSMQTMSFRSTCDMYQTKYKEWVKSLERVWRLYQ